MQDLAALYNNHRSAWRIGLSGRGKQGFYLSDPILGLAFSDSDSAATKHR